MIVCIAEKPSVARDIAEVLGAHTRKEGYIEGNGYQVTWTFGHLCTLKEPHEYTPNWKSWNLGSLPMIPPRFGIKLIENPTYEVGGILHYAVDHTPSPFYKTFTENNSQVILPYLVELMTEKIGGVLKDAMVIEEGRIVDLEIIRFQKR